MKKIFKTSNQIMQLHRSKRSVDQGTDYMNFKDRGENKFAYFTLFSSFA